MQGMIRIRSGRLSAACQKAVNKAAKADCARRVMARDASVFTNKSELKKLIANRLGWTDSAAAMRKKLGEIETFGKGVIRSGITQVVLMGMGGSSLCPDLFRLVHKKHPALKSFDVIDSTDPLAVAAITLKLDPFKTLFIVASKSGGTVETRSHEAHFWGLLKKAGVKNPGSHFCAITDPGSGLEKSAKKLRYRKAFLNPPDIGGRYSALSYFGLVPGFFAGVDIRALVDDAVLMQRLLVEREGETNAALALGSFMAACATAGRDKLTFVASKRTAPLVPWIEQLVAESTGKKKLGVVPIEAEPIGRANLYLKDRAFVFLRLVREKATDQNAFANNLSRWGVPMVEMTLGSLAELGRQFLLWEAATAVAGWHLGINPFDEPNVTESKNNTKAILGAFERSGEFPDQTAKSRFGKLSLIACGGCEKYRKTDSQDLVRLLKRFFAGGKPPNYCSFLNYLKADARTEKLLAGMRAVVRDRTGMATLRGYGPRYLHSVGQLYKGGPATGRFIVFVRARYGRLEIPGEVYGFGQLIAAQAIGDAQALMSRSLSTLVIGIEGGAAPGLEQFLTALRRALK